MKMQLELVAAHLTRSLKQPCSYDGNDDSGTLKVGELKIAAERGRVRRGSARVIRLEGVGRWTDYKHGGYKLHEMIPAIIGAIPTLVERAERRKVELDRQTWLRELRKRHSGDPRVAEMWDSYDGSINVRLRVVDPFELELILDRIHEVDMYAMERPAEQAPAAPQGARLFQLVDDANEPIDEFSLGGIVAKFSAEDAAEELDRLDSMIPGELQVFRGPDDEEVRVIRSK